MAAKKRKTQRIPETQRHTVAVKLRLDPEVAKRLDELAEAWGCNRSEAVAVLVAKEGEGR